jgi:hypothetical protein
MRKKLNWEKIRSMQLAQTVIKGGKFKKAQLKVEFGGHDFT